MKLLKKFCIDCGSPAVEQYADRSRKSETVAYRCGAVLTTVVLTGGIAKVSHSGCTREIQVAPI